MNVSVVIFVISTRQTSAAKQDPKTIT